MASVFKRGQKRWYGRIKVGDRWKIVRLPAVWSGPSAISRDKALYVAIDAEFLANKANHFDLTEVDSNAFLQKLVAITRPEKLLLGVSVKEYCDEWLKTNASKVTESTTRARVYVFAAFYRFIGEDGAKKPVHFWFKKSRVDEFLKWLEADGYARASIQLIVATFSKCAASAINEGKIFTNPFKGVEYGGLAKVNKDVFTIKQADALIASTTGDLHTLFVVMFCTGMRVGDATRLRWDSVDLKEGRIEFIPDKQRLGKERSLVIPISGKLRAELLKARSANDSEFLCPSFAKSPTYAARLKVRGALDEEKFSKGLSAHSCRHFFVSLLANAGITEEIRMRLVGHSSGKNTVHQGYTHLDVKKLAEEIAKVPWLS